MGHKNCAILLTVLLSASSAFAQSTTLIQQASAQFRAAEKAEAALNEKTPADRSRAEYLQVIRAYQRVYLITPHTGWADNALSSIARLYEEIKDTKDAIKTLQFLLHDYPQTPLRDLAERDIVRLSGTGEVTAKDKETTTVENLRFWEEETSVRIVVDISGEVSFKNGEAKSPERFFVDISPARLNSMLIGKEWATESKGLQKIRIAQYDGSTVRVVLDGVTSKSVTASTLKDPNRIILDVATAPSTPSPASSPTSIPVTTPAANSKPISSAAPTTAPKASVPTALPSVSPPAPPVATNSPSVTGTATNSRPVIEATAANVAAPVLAVTEAKPTNRGDRSLMRSLGLKVSRIVIDAGHGGHDTGSIGPSGYTEKELVLDVSQRLKALIEADMGAEVFMTRAEDAFVPLEKRTEIANKEAADLFVSIHVNSSKTKTVRGIETFFLNYNTQSREALETANRENAASELGIHDFQDLIKKLMLKDKVDESRELAEHIQAAMSKRMSSGANRGVKQAPFVVLIGANMPSVLAEISFISNPEEERQLKTPTYRQQIAESLFQGIKSYAETLSSTKTAKAQEKN